MNKMTEKMFYIKVLGDCAKNIIFPFSSTVDCVDYIKNKISRDNETISFEGMLDGYYTIKVKGDYYFDEYIIIEIQDKEIIEEEYIE